MDCTNARSFRAAMIRALSLLPLFAAAALWGQTSGLGPPSPTLTPQLGSIFLADGFPSSCTVSGTSYTTQADCAFYSAKLYATTNNVSPELWFGAGTYTTAASLVMPTGLYVPKLYGTGQQSTILQYSGTAHIPVISRAAGSSAFMDIHNMTIDGNYNATAEIDLLSLNQSSYTDLTLKNNYPNTTYFMRLATGFQQNVERVQAFEEANSGLGNFGSPTTFGYVTCTPSSGTIATGQCTLTSAGSGYPSNYATANILFNGNQNGASSQPCSGTQPVGTATIASGGVSTWSVTTNGTTCAGTVYGVIVAQFPVTYGFQWQVSDSTFKDVITYVGKSGGFWTPTNNDDFYHLHPAFLARGIVNAGSNVFHGTEFDNILQYQYDLQGPNCSGGTACGVSIGPATNFHGAINEPGMTSFLFESGAANTAITAPGSLCGGTIPVGYTEIATATGTIDSGTGAWPANSSMVANDQTCGQTVGDYTPIATIGTMLGTPVFSNVNPFQLSPTNYSDVVYGAQSRTGANQGLFNFQLANATPATSSQNFGGPCFSTQGDYWNATASTPTSIFGCLNFGTGANPSQTFQFSMFGTPSTGPRLYAFDSPIQGTSVSTSDTQHNGAVSFGTGSLGDTSCPTPTTGLTYLCLQSAVLNISTNGAAYAPLGSASLTGSIGQMSYFSAANTPASTSAIQVGSSGTTGPINFAGVEYHQLSGPTTYTTITASVTSSATTAPLASGTGLPTSCTTQVPCLVYLNTNQFQPEISAVTFSGTTMNFIGTRGMFGTSAQAMAATAQVMLIGYLKANTTSSLPIEMDIYNGSVFISPTLKMLSYGFGALVQTYADGVIFGPDLPTDPGKGGVEIANGLARFSDANNGEQIYSSGSGTATQIGWMTTTGVASYYGNHVILAASQNITATTLATGATNLVLPSIFANTLYASLLVHGRCFIPWQNTAGTQAVVFGIGSNQNPGTTLAVTTETSNGTYPAPLKYTPITTTATTAITSSLAVAAASTPYKTTIDFTETLASNVTNIITVYGDVASGGTLQLLAGANCEWVP